MIDTNNWKSFKVSDIFITEKHGSGLQTPTGAMISKKDLEDGDTPRVTVSNYNNGITGYYADSDNKNYRTHENFISVSFLGTVFYQPEKVSLDMKVHCLKPLDYELNVYSAEYIVSIIRKAISNFAYSDQLSSTVLAELEFALPATPNGRPDWDYMESYMKAVMEASEKSLENLKKVNNTKHQINVSGWQKFHLYDNCLFEIDMGTKLDKAKMTEINPVVNFVGRANANNGITARVDKIEGIKPYPEGYMTLSLGGEYLGSCFIQPKPFYTSQNVIVLIPNEHMTDNIKRFIATMIFRTSRSKYRAFIDELNRHIKTDFEIYLPIDANGEPDWQYMEDYMERRLNEAELAVSQLQLAV